MLTAWAEDLGAKLNSLHFDIALQEDGSALITETREIVFTGDREFTRYGVNNFFTGPRVFCDWQVDIDGTPLRRYFWTKILVRKCSQTQSIRPLILKLYGIFCKMLPMKTVVQHPFHLPIFPTATAEEEASPISAAAAAAISLIKINQI